MKTERPTKGTTEPGEDVIGRYEAPRLTAIGNLRDLLAGDGGTSCDGVTQQTTNGHDDISMC